MSCALHSIILLFLMYPTNLVLTQEGRPTGECKNSLPNISLLNVSVDRKLNQSDGKWITTLSASKDDLEPNELDLEAKHKHEECQGRHIISVQVVVKEILKNQSASNSYMMNDKLLFHPRHGSNVVLINNGRSVHKLDMSLPENSVVFTNRPLNINEMFEVRLDKRGGKLNHCMGIGITTHSPEDVPMLPSMHRLNSNSTWMYHNNAIYSSNAKLQNYGHDMNSLQARDRIGVMQMEDRSIHFFVNGEDQGLALPNIQQPIYGIFELWHDALKGTIVY